MPSVGLLELELVQPRTLGRAGNEPDLGDMRRLEATGDTGHS